MPNPPFRIPSTAPSIKLSKVPSCELPSCQCALRHPRPSKHFLTSTAQERLCWHSQIYKSFFTFEIHCQFFSELPLSSLSFYSTCFILLLFTSIAKKKKKNQQKRTLTFQDNIQNFFFSVQDQKKNKKEKDQRKRKEML